MRKLSLLFVALVFIWSVGCNSDKTESQNTGNEQDTTSETIEKQTTQNEREMQSEPKGITLESLKSIKFFGTEPPWTLTFKDEHLNYSYGYENNQVKMVYYGDHDGSNQRIKTISEDEIQVRMVSEAALDKGFIWVATIKKENCSDGMSENTYPYSIKIRVQEGVKEGCGRLVKDKSMAGNDFETFWKKFKKTVASNDKAAFMKLCSPQMKKFFEHQSYESFVNDRMKKEIAKATAKDITDHGESGKLFVYEVVYEENPQDGTAGASTFGFFFKKINGKWMVHQPQIGG